jgi:hypothetical protein
LFFPFKTAYIKNRKAVHPRNFALLIAQEGRQVKKIKKKSDERLLTSYKAYVKVFFTGKQLTG